jgi:hypothetical protein
MKRSSDKETRKRKVVELESDTENKNNGEFDDDDGIENLPRKKEQKLIHEDHERRLKLKNLSINLINWLNKLESLLFLEGQEDKKQIELNIYRYLKNPKIPDQILNILEKPPGHEVHKTVLKLIFSLLRKSSANHWAPLYNQRLLHNVLKATRFPLLQNLSFSILFQMTNYFPCITDLRTDPLVVSTLEDMFNSNSFDNMSFANKLAKLITKIFNTVGMTPELARPFLPFVLKLLRGGIDEKYRTKCSSICVDLVKFRRFIETFLSLGFLPVLVDLLHKKRRSSILCNVLEVLTNLLVGTDEQRQTVLETGLLKRVRPFLKSKREEVQEKAFCFIYVLVVHGDPDQIQTIIDMGIFELIRDEIREQRFSISSPSYSAAIQAMLKIYVNGTEEQIEYVLSLDIYDELCGILSSLENLELSRSVIDALNALISWMPDDFKDTLKQHSISEGIEYYAFHYGVAGLSEKALDFLMSRDDSDWRNNINDSTFDDTEDWEQHVVGYDEDSNEDFYAVG